MLSYIRNLPDPWMVLTMIGIGAVFWSVFLALVILVDKVKSSYKSSCAYRCSQLEKANAYLLKRIQEECNRGRIHSDHT